MEEEPKPISDPSKLKQEDSIKDSKDKEKKSRDRER